MTECTLVIRRNLEAVRKNLISLSDEIWLSFDHDDTDRLEDCPTVNLDDFFSNLIGKELDGTP